MSPALKVCGQPGCTELIAANKRRCPTHGGNKRTGKPRGSTRAWRKLRLQVLRRDGYQCVRCGAPANDVHHRKPVAAGGLDELKNLESLCDKCHNDEHTDDQAPRGATPLGEGRQRSGGAFAVSTDAGIGGEGC